MKTVFVGVSILLFALTGSATALAVPAGAYSAVAPRNVAHSSPELPAVNDAHAAYPLTVDPPVWLEQKVAANDGGQGDFFGWSVAIDGARAIVGVPNATVNGNAGQGAAYVFTNSGGVWTQTQKLTGSDGAQYDAFGQAVAIDGTTVLIGAKCAHYNPSTFQCGSGAAYVFTYSGGTWTQVQELTPSDGAQTDSFGQAVALDGSTALIGASTVTGNFDPGRGKAYIFSKSGGNWTQVQQLIASDGTEFDGFGGAVALDGTTALVGSFGATINGNPYQGAAYVFTNSGGSWTQTAKLTASDGTGTDYFGQSVALDGATALVGEPQATVNGNDYQGAAYVFTNAGGSWTQTQKLSATDGAFNDVFGAAVALDGTTAAIGASGALIDGNPEGAAYIFTYAGGSWTQAQKLTPSDGEMFDGFGQAAALDGGTALMGAFGTTVDGNSQQGAAYFYGESDLGLAVNAPQTVGQGHTYVSQTIVTDNAGAASPAVSATITVPASASFVSASATQGSCSEASGVVTCDFGQISGNGGTATANVTLKATGNVGDAIENTAGIAKATPPLAASAETTITAGGACPDGYTEYDGSLNAGKRAHSPIYRAPAGMENAILTGPSGFQLYAVLQNAQGRKIYRIPGNEVHRRAPGGYFTWVVAAGDTGGASTLCLLHP